MENDFQISTDLSVGDKCPECVEGKMTEDTRAGEIVCTNCGCVAQQKISDKEISNIEQLNHVTSNLTIKNPHDKKSTMHLKDSEGKSLSGSAKNLADRLKLWDQRIAINPTEQRLFKRFNEVQNWGLKLGANEAVLRQAGYLMVKASESNISISVNIAVACLYEAAKEHHVPITIKNLSDVSKVSSKELFRALRVLNENLELSAPLDSAETFLPKIANNSGASEIAKRNALKLIQRVSQDSFFVGTAPHIVAASTLYYECVRLGEEIKQKDIATAASITEVTIRANCRKLRNAKY